MNATTIISIIAALGLGAPITVLITGLFNRKKGRVDAAQVIQGMAIGVAEEVRQQLKDTKTELDEVKARLAQSEKRIDDLENDVYEERKRTKAYETALTLNNIPIPVV